MANVDVRLATGNEGAIGGRRVSAGSQVAFVDGALAGVAEFHGRFFGHRFIELLLVDERYRRRGVASTLIAACAESASTDRLFTSTNTSNLAAQALFFRSGFQQSGSIGNLDEGDPELIFCMLLDSRSHSN
jgi:ribosomal protein S18 acetylase RimI-like enzyme